MDLPEAKPGAEVEVYEVVRKEVIPRWRVITVKDLDKYGYTERCPKCLLARKYGYHRCQGAEHNAECRERIYTELAKTAEGRDRLARMDDRFARFCELRQEFEEAQS